MLANYIYREFGITVCVGVGGYLAQVCSPSLNTHTKAPNPY